MKYVLLLLLILPIASAATISEYPYLFVNGNQKFDALYVVGEEAPSKDVVSATVISTALAKYPNVTTKVGTSTIDTQIADITKHNAIVVGSPCENRAAEQLHGNPVPCYSKLSASSGQIELYRHNGKYQLLITGITEEDRYKAAKFLANNDLSDLDTTKHVIKTGTNSNVTYFQQKNTIKKETKKSGVIYTPSEESEKEETDSVEKIKEPEPEPKAEEPSKEPEPLTEGDYEPLEELPERKGLFSRLWLWLKNLFK